MDNHEDTSEAKPAASFQVTDRRFWVNDESLVDRTNTPGVKYPTVVEELKRRTEAAEQKLKERLASLEAENAAFRERMARQVEQRSGQIKAELIKDLLEVLDCFDRALAAADAPTDFKSLREGVALNRELFLAKLKAAGVESVDVLGQPFDPNVAEAIGMTVVSDPSLEGVTVDVDRPGYLLDGKLLRPAGVKVGKYVTPPE